MSYRDPTYVIFDGDNDMWAYAYMKGWKENEKVDFHFDNAHELDSMTSRAQGEHYVKWKLRERMQKSSAALALIGANTKNLYRFVRWELELAQDLDLPIIAVNLNEQRRQDNERCPAIIRDTCAVHVPFKMKIIKHALDNWPAEYRGFGLDVRKAGARHYADDVYGTLGL